MARHMVEILDALADQGWRVELRKGAGHYRAFPPDRSRQPVTLPLTPGGGRWRENAIADLRRSGYTWHGR